MRTEERERPLDPMDWLGQRIAVEAVLVPRYIEAGRAMTGLREAVDVRRLERWEPRRLLAGVVTGATYLRPGTRTWEEDTGSVFTGGGPSILAIRFRDAMVGPELLALPEDVELWVQAIHGAINIPFRKVKRAPIQAWSPVWKRSDCRCGKALDCFTFSNEKIAFYWWNFQTGACCLVKDEAGYHLPEQTKQASA